MNKPITSAGWPRTLFYILQFTWGLPVNLVGLLVFLCCGRFRHEPFHNSIVTYLPGNHGGLSLGIFIFVSSQSLDADFLCAHEYGHTVQCLFLGPLYWLIIAIPSFVWFHLFADFRKKTPYPLRLVVLRTLGHRVGEEVDRGIKKPQSQEVIGAKMVLAIFYCSGRIV